MSRSRSAEQPRGKSKHAAAVEELTRGIEKFRELLAQVEDLSREGFPYRDAVRARAELHIRHSIKRIFGDKSPEYQRYKAHKLRINSPEETAHSIVLLEGLIASLENRKLDLLGIKPAPPLPDTSSHSQPAQARPHLSLVPPPGAPTQETITPMAGTEAPVAPSPITMSVAFTTNLDPSFAPPIPSTNRIPSTPGADRAGATGPAPTPAFLASVPVQEANACPPVSTPSPAHSSESRTEEPAASIAPLPASVGRIAEPSASTAQPQAGSKIGVGPALDPLEQVRKLCSRFHAVVRQMRLRREYRATLEVEDEYDVQDLLHALLRLEFDEIEIEDWTPSYTEGGNRTTFFLAKNTIAVVVKKTRPGLGGREVAEQVQIDSERYRARKHCGTLLCFVYDPEGRIGNPRGFESDLTSVSDQYTIDVVVAPK